MCKLRKSLYGLQQVPWLWYFKLATALQDYGFAQSPLDHSLFVYNKHHIYLALLVYVDDLVLTRNSSSRCGSFKTYVNKCFKLKDLSHLKYFWGIEVARSSKDYSSIKGNILWTFCLRLVCWVANLLCFLWRNGLNLLIHLVFPFWILLNTVIILGGSFISPLLVHPDITYLVHALSQFMQDPQGSLWCGHSFTMIP